MAEQADAAAGKVASFGKGIGEVVVWLLAAMSGFIGYAVPQSGFDAKKIVANLMTMFKLNQLFPGTELDKAYSLIAGAILTGIGGTALYWGMKYDKLIGAFAKILGAHLLGRGVRFIFSGLGG
jgi:hypothetical protein